jgi:hypothetical protein
MFRPLSEQVDADRLDRDIARALRVVIRFHSDEVKRERRLFHTDQRELLESVAQIGEELMAALEHAQHVQPGSGAMEVISLANVVCQPVDAILDEAMGDHHRGEIRSVVFGDNKVLQIPRKVVRHVEWWCGHRCRSPRRDMSPEEIDHG